MQIKFEASHLSIIEAALQFAAKKDIRYYLNGVKFEVSNNVATVWATDTHVLFGAKFPCECEGSGEWILASEGIAAALKAAKYRTGGVTLTVDDNRFTIEEIGGKPLGVGETLECERYPDVYRVIPRNAEQPVEGTASAFNAEFFGTVAKAAKVLAKMLDLRGGLSVRCDMPREGYMGGSVVTFCGVDAFALAMSRKSKAPTVSEVLAKFHK